MSTKALAGMMSLPPAGDLGVRKSMCSAYASQHTCCEAGLALRVVVERALHNGLVAVERLLAHLRPIPCISKLPGQLGARPLLVRMDKEGYWERFLRVRAASVHASCSCTGSARNR